MKIIDEKGKLFEKVNVIDFLVILFFLFLTPMLYFGYKVFHMKPAAPVRENKKDFTEIELRFILKKIPPQVLSLISVGDKEISEDKENIAEILGLGEVMPYNYEVTVGSVKKVITNSVFKDLPVTLRIKAEIRQNSLYYKDRQITDNASIDFVTDKYKLEAFYMPNLIENNYSVENVSASIKTIRQKQKEIEYEVSKLQGRISSLENSITSKVAPLVAEGQKSVKNE